MLQHYIVNSNCIFKNILDYYGFTMYKLFQKRITLKHKKSNIITFAVLINILFNLELSLFPFIFDKGPVQYRLAKN